MTQQTQIQVQMPPRQQVLAMAQPHPRAETYPHLLRDFDWLYWPRRMSWRPLVGAILMLLVMFLIAPMVLIPIVLLPGALIENGTHGLGDYVGQQMGLEIPSPSAFLFMNLTLASAIPAGWLLMRYLHRLRFGWLWSVAARFRWKFFAACLAISVLALGVSLGMSALLMGEEGLVGDPQPWTSQLTALAIVIALSTPLQAMGEEFAFRGYLLIGAGSFFGWVAEKTSLTPQRARTVGTWVGITVTALVFAAFHGAQNFPLFFDRFAFGFIAAVLVVRTGGMEAGIALHILNNLMAFALALAFDDIVKTLKVTEAPWENIPVTIVQNLVYLVVVMWVARRMGVARHTAAYDGAHEPSEHPTGQPLNTA